MFTGIVEEAGGVIAVAEKAESIRLRVHAAVCGADAAIGDSIAVNGCCLTVVAREDVEGGTILDFDLLRETWNRTNLRFAVASTVVNLERSMAANGRIHGHFVTGHVDGTGTIKVFEQRGADWFLQVAAEPALLRYVAFKGAIAIDGISLTVAEVGASDFAVWIIPHTRAVTALRSRKVGDAVNLEADLLAKYVEKLAAPPGAGPA